MPRKHKGGWKWNVCAVFTLADCVRRGDSSTVCAHAIMNLQRGAYPQMDLNNNSVIAAMRSQTVPAMLRCLCPDAEDVVQKFHTHKPGRGKKGKGGSKSWSISTDAPEGAITTCTEPTKPITAAQFLEFRRRQKESPAQ